MLFSFTYDGSITRMNQTMQTELGLEFSTDCKVRLQDLVTVGSRIFLQTHLIPLVTMQGFAKEIYLTFKVANGTDIPILLNITRLTDGAVEELHCGGMIISNRSRFEKELLLAKTEAQEALSKNEELQKIRAELEVHQRQLEVQLRTTSALYRQHHEIFKVIAHDLQEPLRKSVLFADLIKSQNKDLPKDASDKLDRIIAFNQHMRDMLMSLQRLEELENRKMDLQNINLKPLIESALKQSAIESSSVKIQYNIDCENLSGDQELLKNMFIELFLNAIRFCNPENSFCIIVISSMIVQRNIFMESAEKYLYEDFIKITFSDNGVGFNSDSSLVFKIFQRGEQFDSISPGLAYCRRIVELHHGTIIAKSITGQGAGFTIFIPLKQNF